jgi:hypothetical protein
VKRLCADDSAATSVKVGHRQAVIPKIPKRNGLGIFFCFVKSGEGKQRARGRAKLGLTSSDQLPLRQNCSSYGKKPTRLAPRSVFCFIASLFEPPSKLNIASIN